MDLVSLLITLIIVGAVLYVVSLLPIDGTIKTVIKVIAIVVLLVWLIKTFLPAVV